MPHLTSSALHCIHLHNSAFGQPEDIAHAIFQRVTEYKHLLSREITSLWSCKTKTAEEEAELLIGVLLSSVMVSVPEPQQLLDRTCRVLSKLSDSPLKARLLIALYTLTDDEEDREEALRIIEERGDEEARELLREVDCFTTDCAH